MKVGSVFLIHDPIVGTPGSFAVLDPDLSLEDIAAHLSDVSDTDVLSDIIIGRAAPDVNALCEPTRFWPYYCWERREKGIDRWKNFKERGGEVDLECWGEIETDVDEGEYFYTT